MKKLIYTFLSRPVTTGMFLLCVIVLGIAAFFNIPIELAPEITLPKLSVSAYWNKVSPEAVEAFLTSPLEASLATVKGVKKISSHSSEGNCYVNLEFHPATNMDFARVEINEKLSALKDELPYGVSPPILSSYIPDDFKDLQGFLTFTVSANRSAGEVRKLVVEKLQNSIVSIDGISDVSINGGSERQINITIDYEKAKSFGVTNEEITRAISESEKILSVGNIKYGNGQFAIKIFNTVDNIDILKEQPVKALPNGNVIRIKDIGLIIDGYKVPTNFYRINGKESVTIEISKEPGVNTLKTAENVFSSINTLKKELPSDFVITKEIDKSEVLRNELSTLYSNAVYSFIILIIALFLIFRRIKYSLIIIISILFSLLFSSLLFYVFNISINMLTLSSITLGFGIIVDNSVVVIDYVDRKYQGQNIKRLSLIICEIFFPVFASTLTTISVFLPLVLLTGELKVYFSQFALATAFTVSSSLLVSFTVVPLFFHKFAYNRNQLNKVKENKFIFRVYSFILSKMINWKKVSIVFIILLIGLPVWLLPQRIENSLISPIYNSVFDSDFFNDVKRYIDYSLGGSLNLFFNHMNRGEIWGIGEETYLTLMLELPNGNNIERLNTLVKKIEKEVLSYRKNIKTITSNIFDEENAYIRIDFTEEQGKTAFPYLLKNYLTSYAIQLGGLDVSITGFGPGYYNGGSSSSYSYAVKVMGFNYKDVKSMAEEFKEILIGNPRIDNIDMDRSMLWGSNDIYEIAAIVNRDKLSQHYISVNSLLETISKNTNGNLSWNRFRMGNDEVNYEIKFSNYRDIQIDELANLIIENSQGSFLKVKDLVDFQQRKVLSVINREDRQYVRYITFDYKGPYLNGNEFVINSVSSIKVPEGFKIEKEDLLSFMLNKDKEVEIWKILSIAIILIFMISAGLFESYKKPFLVLFAVPFAFIGTICLFYFGDFTLDRGAYAGLLLLIGISVNNSIILVDYISRNITENSLEQIIKLSYKRLRPIFTTTFTTVSALIPLILNSKDGFWKSLALSVAGGIIFSSIMTVLYIPILFSILNRKQKLDQIKSS